MPKKTLLLSTTLIVFSGVLAYYSKVSFSEYSLKNSGAVFGESTMEPSNFPKELKLPPDAKIVSSIEGKKGSQITFETTESETGIKSLLEESLGSEGWAKVEGDGLIKNGSSLNVQIAPSEAEGLNVVTISYLIK